MTLILPPCIAEELLELAGAQPEVEVCGLLGGHGNRMQHFYPIANVAAQPATHFLLAAAEQIEAMRTMRERGEHLRGIFHSHPTTAARPSASDQAQAHYTDTYYLIVSLMRADAELAAFHYDGSHFQPVSIAGH